MLEFKRRGVPSREALPGYPLWLSELMRNRGIDTPEKAALYLEPRPDQLHDPFLMQDMDKAAAILREAARLGLPITVYGDYDCDGVCSVSIMLETLRELGAQVDYRIPDRHSEGYGLCEKAVAELLRRGTRVLLTVDCGITNLREVQQAKDGGMQVIVTDHHQLGEELPAADAILNPLRGGYPFPRLCGAGVALKLTQALLGMEAALRRADLAALATVADVVPLVGENRIIVRTGLERINGSPRPGIRALISQAAVIPPVTSSHIAFRLAPRINSAGRLERADQGVELLTCGSLEQAAPIAEHLEETNRLRTVLQSGINAECERQMRTDVDFRDDQVILLMGEGWNSGVIGLAAGRICETCHFPTVVLSRSDDVAVGSCRSIPGVNIHRMLTLCDQEHRRETGESLFLRFGGHEQAAGLTIRAGLVPELRQRLNEAIRRECDPAAYIPTEEYDTELPLSEVSLGLVSRLESLQPTGWGNPDPVFLTRDAEVLDLRAVGTEKSHLKMTLRGEDGRPVDAIAFRRGRLAREGLRSIDLLYTPERNEYLGRVSPQLQVKALRRTDGLAGLPGEDVIFHALWQEIGDLVSNENQIQEALPGCAPETIPAEAARRMLQGVRGTLLIAHEAGRAAGFLDAGPCDLALRRVEDRRAYNTLLIAPDPAALQDCWHTVVLLDGDLLPGEAALIRRQCPRARLCRLPDNPAVREQLLSLRPDLEALRRIYRALLSMQGESFAYSRLAALSGQDERRCRAALRAYAELKLITCREEPLHVALLPHSGAKVDILSAPTLAWLNRL